MKPDLKILLVRHCQSEANVDATVNQRKPDHAIALTAEGERQAAITAKNLREIIQDFPQSNFYQKARLWVSPYQRTRQTADYIEKALRTLPLISFDRKENVRLAEQQFGLFDGLSDEERETQFPQYYNHIKKFDGQFWARLPMGESRFDVVNRVDDLRGLFRRNQENHNINLVIVVAHGTVNRALRMAKYHYPYEWFEKEPNPGNGSIWLLDNESDSCLFKGF